MPQNSTIQVSYETKKKLTRLQNYPNESFEKIIKRMVEYIHAEEDEILTKDDLSGITNSLMQIQEGKFKTLSQLRKKYPKK